jgi:glutaredoxin
MPSAGPGTTPTRTSSAFCFDAAAATAHGPRMLDAARALAHRTITSPVGESLLVVRLPKEIARTVNELLGAPLASREELERRRAASARLVELRKGPRVVETKREPAPVTVYFEKDRNARELQKVKDVLGAHAIAPRLLDLTGDEATTAFVMREAKCERDELPVVFVADRVIGGFRELVAFDARGELRRAVFG